MKRRFGVLISGNGSTLQALLDSRDHIEIGVVISSSDQAYGVLRARRAGVNVEVLPPELKGQEKRHDAEQWMIGVLRKYKIQRVFLCGYMKIVSENFIKEYEGRIFNIHPSLLPKYRGLHSFDEALKNGDTSAGATIHHVVKDVDAGEFILQREFEVPPSRFSDKSHLFLHIQEQRMIRESLRKL